MNPLTRTKSYPDNYSSDVVKIFDAMTFTKGKNLTIMGSSSLRSQQYAGDYDGLELVELNMDSDKKALDWLADRFKSMMKELRGMKNVYIGDIKAGVIEEWRVVPTSAKVVAGKVEGYNATKARGIIDRLLQSRVITEGEAEKARSYIKDSPTPTDLVLAKDGIKFHIVRWTVADVLQGQKRLRDGRTFTLQEAFSTPGLTKLDAIALVQKDRYTDFSVIYHFKNKGKTLNYVPTDFIQSIKEDIIALEAEGNPFKILKRKFSLARYLGKEKDIARFSAILNSDLGRLYVVLGDIGTLIALLEDYDNVPLDIVRYEIDQFKNRLSTIYSLEEYIKNEHDILADINKALKQPTRDRIVVALKALGDNLATYLKESAQTKLSGGSAKYVRFHIGPGL